MTASEAMREIIAAQGGVISVERFMQEALYHPRFGYYARYVRQVGPRGDFSTSATLHHALGQAIAAWACAHRRKVIRGRKWHLVELGGGGGHLAERVLAHVPWWKKRGLRYHLVEVSSGLRQAQQARLISDQRGVFWHENVQDALAAAGGNALLFSNEFVDAFPCRQWAYAPGQGWREVCVAWPPGAEHPVEILVAVPDAEAAELPPAPAAACRIETHRAYSDWLHGCAAHWKQGRMLTLDYGTSDETSRRPAPGGTLRAYCQHLRLTGVEVFRRIGQQDLTADVNFSDLCRWGAREGWLNAPLATQAEFLRRWLPAKALESKQPDTALRFLLDPDGAGGAFKALEQTRLADQNAA